MDGSERKLDIAFSILEPSDVNNVASNDWFLRTFTSINNCKVFGENWTWILYAIRRRFDGTFCFTVAKWSNHLKYPLCWTWADVKIPTVWTNRPRFSAIESRLNSYSPCWSALYDLSAFVADSGFIPVASCCYGNKHSISLHHIDIYLKMFLWKVKFFCMNAG